MRKVLVAGMLLLVAAAALPARAETTAVVITSGNQYLPGDKDLLSEAGAPGVAPPVEVTLFRGDEMLFANADVAPHSLTSVLLVNGTPRFGSNTLIGTGGTQGVRGVTSLAVGRYDFRCVAHSFMRGVLNVIPARPA